MSVTLRSLLLVEKSLESREKLAGFLRKDVDCVVYTAETSEQAVEILENGGVCVVMVGLDLPLYKDLPFLRYILRHHSQVVVVAVVPLGDQAAIAEALRVGAFSCVNAPYDFTEAVIVAARALYYYDLFYHQEKRGCKIRKSDGFYGIIGKSAPMCEIFQLIGKLGEDGQSTVLIEGESGTGKELVAKAIHAASSRSHKNFVPLNCAAIPDELLESELFGYRKGAFTGAAHNKIGYLQFADGGTLFLDEIGDMQPMLQAKLLRVLQEHSFVPVGAVEAISIDVRIMAATHRNLEQMVQEGRFREDLYYRLSVVPIHIPPLRDRREDISLLIDKFIQIFNRNRPSPLRGLTPAARALLNAHPWPGNVRELENLIQRLVILHGGQLVDIPDLPEKLTSGAPAYPSPGTGEIVIGSQGVDFDQLVARFEDQLIMQALQITGGNKKEAALLLHLNRTTLLEKIKKKGLNLP